ncbi:MAG: glucose 1-dehydrogenase [Candidatus Binataceae bacterium]|jgi:3-oxoacyl-[acyl-carrier protein] reductase
MRLEGKVAIVTGGASGFGAGIVRKFVAEGARVVVADRDAASAARVAAEAGPQARAVTTDITQDAQVAAMVAAATEAFGGLHILVNNAGIIHAGQPLESLAEEVFDRVFGVNAKAIYLTARHVVPLFKRAKAGVILNIGSTGAVRPRPNLTWYNATKGWVLTATRGMAIELAQFGIRVNAINPGAGDTPLLKNFMGGDNPAMRAALLATIPFGRYTTPQDIGNAAAFLCSDEASMITGVALEVDGGRCI